MQAVRRCGYDCVVLRAFSRLASGLIDGMIKLEDARVVRTYKLGVLRWLDGQDEDAAFSNQVDSY